MRRSLAAALLLLTLGPKGAWAIQKPSTRDRVLADFDIRWGAAPARGHSSPLAAADRLDLLRARLRSSLHTRLHPLTGSVRVLWAAGEPLSEGGDEALPSARRFLRENAALLGLTPQDTAGLREIREDLVSAGALRRIRFQQVLDGLPVFEGVVALHLDREGRVVKLLAGPLSPGRAEGALAPSPALSAEDAFRRAVANVRPELRFAARPLASEGTADLVWFPTAAGARLAWKVKVDPGGFPQVYDILVDATSGEVLYRRNRVRYAEGTGTVPQSDSTQLQDPRQPDEHPAGSDPSGPADPPGGCPPTSGYLSRNLDAPFRDPATVLAQGGRLRGNNTTVYRRNAPVFGALGTLDGTTWRFEYPFGSADSVETALFFSTNFAHDFFYDLGFDEAAGNFQADNFGRGGTGGDSLVTLARANGRNNATFEPAPEGQSPTMSLFLFDGTGCWAEDTDGDGVLDLDGGYDTDVIIHEYHHGVSLRLNPDFTGPEADAIGEGGGDFFAYSLSGNTQLAEYSVPPLGIREINGKTYADWSCFLFFFCEPHDNGEIWANVLWDLRERFRADLVRGSEASAVEEMHSLYLDGLALSPPAPTMLDLRDAMLQADLLRNPDPSPGGSANHCRIWSVFAGRGLGQGALDTQDTGDNTVVASDLVADACPQTPRVSLALTDPQAAEAGLDPARFIVTRTASTAAELTVAYSVSGTATPDDDYEALTGTIVVPAGSSTAAIAVTPRDDSRYEPVETVIVTLLPDPAYLLQGTTTGTARITSDDPGPDLTVIPLTAPALTGAGLTVSATDTTKNQGAGLAAPSTTSFHLSANSILDTSDVFLGSRSAPELAGGATSIATTALAVPAGTATGNYYLIARADSETEIAETNEGNNTRAINLAVGPDLVVSQLVAPATAGPGLSVSVTETTKNQGGGLAPPTTTVFYLSSNTLYDAGDVPIGSRLVPELLPSASSTVVTLLTVPASTPAGNYYLVARADGTLSLPETGEINNPRIAPLAVGPDLTVSTFTAPAAGGPGLALSVTDTTRNQGAGEAPPSTTSYYLSLNTVLDAPDVLVGSRTAPGLAPNTSSLGSALVTIPTGTAAGTYYLIARADSAALVPETNEANNTRSSAIALGPDLVVSAFTSPASAAPGHSLSVSDTTKNQGAAPAPPSTTSFYLSSNAVFDAGDVLLGSRSVPELGQNATSALTTALTIPPATPAGSYFVIARADGDGLVPETLETNNIRVAALALGPDLVVSAFTAPSPTGPGQVLSVTDTTKNQGAGTAPATTTSFYLSSNTLFDPGDVLLGSRAAPELGPSATSVVTTPLTIPAGTTPGAYYVIARADADGLVGESNEGNNTRVAAVTVTSP